VCWLAVCGREQQYWRGTANLTPNEQEQDLNHNGMQGNLAAKPEMWTKARFEDQKKVSVPLSPVCSTAGISKL